MYQKQWRLLPWSHLGPVLQKQKMMELFGEKYLVLQPDFLFSFIFWWCFFILFCFLNKPQHQAPVVFQFFFNPLVKCSGEETKCTARNVALTWKVQCSPPELTSEGRSGKTMSLFVSEVRVGIKVENAWDPSVEVSPSLSGEPRQILLPGSWCLHSSKHLEER